MKGGDVTDKRTLESLLYQTSMIIVKRFIQSVNMSIQDFKAKKEVNALRQSF